MDKKQREEEQSWGEKKDTAIWPGFRKEPPCIYGSSSLHIDPSTSPQRPSVSTSHSPWKLLVFSLSRMRHFSPLLLHHSIIFLLDRARFPRQPFNLTFGQGTRDQRLLWAIVSRGRLLFLYTRRLTSVVVNHPLFGERERERDTLKNCAKEEQSLIPIFIRTKIVESVDED